MFVRICEDADKEIDGLDDFKEKYIKEEKNSYDLGFEDGYNKCHSEFKEAITKSS